MHPSGTQMIGPSGPYHELLPPNQLPSNQLPPHQLHYHTDQVPTAAHPSWHNASYPCLPTPPYHQPFPPPPPPHSQTHPNYPLMHQQQPHPPQQHHPQMTPQAPLTQQQQVQQQHHRSAYSSPSPTTRAPSAPIQNQKLRTEQWVQWPYPQSPAPSMAPSMMSYHHGEDRMSMLSINTTMTNQYPDSQRSFPSNGSTCENVNPEMMQDNYAQLTEQSLREWFSILDPTRRLQMAKRIQEWVSRDKMEQLEPTSLPNHIQNLLNIIHDGLKPPRVMYPPAYLIQLPCYLIEILFQLTSCRTVIPHMNLIIQSFSPREHGDNEFRALICNLLRPYSEGPQALYCSGRAFKVFENIMKYLKNSKNEKMRLDFAHSLKFDGLFQIIMGYLDPQLHSNRINPIIMNILHHVISRDQQLRIRLIWGSQQQREQLPSNSLILSLKGVIARCHYQMVNFHDPASANRNMDLDRLIQVVLRTLEVLNLLTREEDTMEAFAKSNGVELICNIISYRNNILTRAGFQLLVQVSDAKVLTIMNLKDTLPFIMTRLQESLKSKEEDDIVSGATGFLSNVVAHKNEVKELALANHAIILLHEIILKYTPLTDFIFAPKKICASEIIGNSLRLMNNFLMMWIPTQNGPIVTIREYEKQQVCRFIEPEILKRLMTCLSIEASDNSLLELQCIILRFFTLILRSPDIPKNGILNVTDDIRKNNLVGHICVAFSWAIGPQANERAQKKTNQLKNTLIERIFLLLIRLMDQYGENQVAHDLYVLCCPLILFNRNLEKPQLIIHILKVCDKILQFCPALVDSWSAHRHTLDTLENHRNPEIANFVKSILMKFPVPDSQMDEGILQSPQMMDL